MHSLPRSRSLHPSVAIPISNLSLPCFPVVSLVHLSNWTFGPSALTAPGATHFGLHHGEGRSRDGEIITCRGCCRCVVWWRSGDAWRWHLKHENCPHFKIASYFSQILLLLSLALDFFSPFVSSIKPLFFHPVFHQTLFSIYKNTSPPNSHRQVPTGVPVMTSPVNAFFRNSVGVWGVFLHPFNKRLFLLHLKEQSGCIGHEQ